MIKKKILLPTKRFAKADEQELAINFGLEENKNLLREGDRNVVLDIDEQFKKERNESLNYKIYGKVKMVFRNMYSGTTTYNPLKKHLYLVSDGLDSNQNGFMPYNEFAFRRDDILREGNTIDSGTNLSGFTSNINLIGTEYTGHTTTTQENAAYKNWNFYLSYVYDKDENYTMNYTLSGGTNYSFIASDGIPFRVVDNGSYYKLTSPIKHGMSSGEYVVLDSSVGGTQQQRTLNIESIGDELYNSNYYVINILKSDIPSGVTISGVTFGRRCLDRNNITDTISNYYVHKHKVVTEIDDYMLDKCGFEKPLWEEEKKLLARNLLYETDVLVERNRMESVLFDFKNPFVLSGITNNLGYTPTEIYLTVISRNENGYFSYPPKNGYKFNLHNSWIDEQFDDTNTDNLTNIQSSGFTSNFGTTGFTAGLPLSGGTDLVGSFIEYNPTELEEKVISVNYHKIVPRLDMFDYGQDDDTLFSGATTTNQFGYIYQPHYPIKLRQLSPYIETSTSKNIYNLPDNAKYFENEGMWKWRDLYDHGFIDADGYGTNYPFTNNNHYIKLDVNFYLRNERLFTNKDDGLDNLNNFKIEC